MAGEKPKQVFVSYSNKNRDFTRRLIESLRGSGITANSALGVDDPKDRMESISRYIEAADAYVVLVGPESSEWQRREWQLALEETWEHPGKQFIPVLLDENVKPPAFLSEENVIVARSPEGTVFEQVLQLLRRPSAPSVSYKASDERKKRLDYIGKVAVEIKKFNA